MRITSKGQVTIPAEIRAQAGLLPLTEVAFAYRDGVVTITPVEARPGTGRGRQIVDHLRANFGRKGGSGMTTDEIMSLMRGLRPDEA